MSDKDVELDTEAKQLQLQLLKEETRKKIAETRAATLASEAKTMTDVLTDAQTKLVAKAVDLGETGGASLVPVVAADQLGRIAKAIADIVRGRVPKQARLFVVDDRSVAAGDVIYLAVSGRIDQYLTDLTTMEQAVRLGMTPAVPPDGARKAAAEQAQAEMIPAAGLTTLASLAVNAAALFKQEITVRPREVTVEPSALIAEIACLVQGEVTVVLPGFGIMRESVLYERFHQALARRLALERAVAEAETVALEATNRRVTALTETMSALWTSYATAAAKGDDTSKGIKAVIVALGTELSNEETAPFLAQRANVATARKLLTEFDAFVTSVTAVPSGGTHSPLSSAALREQFRGQQNGAGGRRDETFLMHVAITAQGGDAVSRSGLFFWAQKAAFLAAVQATYVVATATGEVLASGSVTRFGAADYDFKKLKLREATS